jgi:hypothetical protein
VALLLQPPDDERGIAAAIAVPQPEAVLAVESFRTAPADERDLELVRERTDRDRVVGAVRAGDADASLIDEKPAAIGDVAHSVSLRMQTKCKRRDSIVGADACGHMPAF